MVQLSRFLCISVLLLALVSCTVVTVSEAFLRPRPRTRKILKVDKLQLFNLSGPESFAFDSNGHLYTSVADGTVRRIDLSTQEMTVYAYSVPNLPEETRAQCGTSPAFEFTCGRPLGILFDSQENLYIADAYKGILRVPRSDPSQVEVLSTESPDGQRYVMANALLLDEQEKYLYFTDSNLVYPRFHFVNITIANAPDGRLLRMDLETNEVEVLVSDLRFANGIAFNKDRSAILINETSQRRIRRYYLPEVRKNGRKRGTTDNFVNEFNCFNDNIKSDKHGNLWVGCFAEGILNEWISAAQDHPELQELLQEHLDPNTVLSKVKLSGLAIKLDGRTGRVLEEIYDSTGAHIAAIAEAEEHNGELFLGSVVNPFIGRIKLNDPTYLTK